MENNIQVTYDSHKNMIIKIPNEIINQNNQPNKAFENCDFITLNKSDASAIYQWLEKYVDKFDGDDVKAFGVDVSLSFERLYDRLEGLIYP